MPGSFHHYYCFKSKRQNISKNQSDEFFPLKSIKLSQIQGVKLKQTSWAIEQGTKALSHVELKKTRSMFSCHPKASVLPPRPGKSSSALEDAVGLVGGAHQCSSDLLPGWKSDSHCDLAPSRPFSCLPKGTQQEHHLHKPRLCLAAASLELLGLCWLLCHRLAWIRATLVSGEVSLLSQFQRLDCGLCYRSPTLHLLETPSPDTPTWFLRFSVYSSPSASQMFQLHQILLLQFSLKYAPLPFCSSSDQL